MPAFASRSPRSYTNSTHSPARALRDVAIVHRHRGDRPTIDDPGGAAADIHGSCLGRRHNTTELAEPQGQARQQRGQERSQLKAATLNPALLLVQVCWKPVNVRPLSVRTAHVSHRH